MNYQREIALRGSCQTNMRNVVLALQLYSQDYTDRMPLANGGNRLAANLPGQPNSGPPIGWAYHIDGYLKCISCLQCPKDETSGVIYDTRNSYTDFWFNARLSGMSRSSLPNANSVVLLGEGNDGFENTGASYSKTKLPPEWLKNSASPLQRHSGGANYAFADGHIIWLRADAINANSSTSLQFKLR